MYDNYGDLAGFANFAGANDTSEAPVVRYQDLHRTHAPASAGLAVRRMSVSRMSRIMRRG